MIRQLLQASKTIIQHPPSKEFFKAILKLKFHCQGI